jgi:Domain of unknown function (DUF4112)
MASFAAKFVAKKIFKETAANKHGQEASHYPSRPLTRTDLSQDPYFETVPATRMGFKSKKKLPRALPPGLTPKEEKVLVKAKRRAYKIDMSLGSFLGTKIGYGAIIGLIPGFGDVADMLLALMVYRTICSVEPELNASVKMKMKFNIVIDFLMGLIPFVGDIADAVYKCNTKNVIILESELRKRGEQRLRGTPQAGGPDPSLADEFDYQNEEAHLTNQNGPPPRYASRRESRRDRRDRDVERADGIPPPQPARPR